MAKKNVDPNTVSADDRVLAELQTANRLLAILVTRGMEQRDAIALLNGMSFSPRAIAAALSITANAVSVAIHRMKKVEQPAGQKTSSAQALTHQAEQNG